MTRYEYLISRKKEILKELEQINREIDNMDLEDDAHIDVIKSENNICQDIIDNKNMKIAFNFQNKLIEKLFKSVFKSST